MPLNFPSSYVAVQCIGRGGFGEVWEARNSHDGQTCVVKFPRAPYTEGELWRFSREVRIQSQLDHQHIVPILDFDLSSDPPWLVMPQAEMNLDDALPYITTAQALGLFLDCCTGVSYAHKNHVLHRDLKPENVLLFGPDTEAGYRAAVSDFGLSRLFTRDTPLETQTNAQGGTPWYAAPEQLIDFKSADERADIYGLGRILEHILRYARVHDAEAEDTQRKLNYCVARATAQNPASRYGTVDALIADFRLILEQPQLLERPEDSGLALVQGLLEAGQFESGDTAPLAQLLFQYRDNYRLMIRLVPRLPAPILRSLFLDHAEPMRQVLDSYIGFLREPLATDYAQSACKVLEAIYEISPSQDIRGTAITTIVSIASTYDLWDVGYIIARIIDNEHDPAVLLELREHFTANPEDGRWCAPFVRNLNMPNLLSQVIHS
jgi:eukaryotic-like serine/threonine-protein kinase